MQLSSLSNHFSAFLLFIIVLILFWGWNFHAKSDNIWTLYDIPFFSQNAKEKNDITWQNHQQNYAWGII